jgi:hypothetical protein
VVNVVFEYILQEYEEHDLFASVIQLPVLLVCQCLRMSLPNYKVYQILIVPAKNQAVAEIDKFCGSRQQKIRGEHLSIKECHFFSESFFGMPICLSVHVMLMTWLNANSAIILLLNILKFCPRARMNERAGARRTDGQSVIQESG